MILIIQAGLLKHCHNKRKDSLEKRAAFIEISMLSWKLPNGPKHRGSLFKKIWLSLKRISYLQVIFMLFWIKWTLVCFILQRNGTANGLSNIKDTFAESFQRQLSVLHQSMYIFKAGLSGLNDDWAKYKEKVPDVLHSNQNVKTTCNSKLKFVELKYLFIKRV